MQCTPGRGTFVEFDHRVEAVASADWRYRTACATRRRKSSLTPRRAARWALLSLAIVTGCTACAGPCAEDGSHRTLRERIRARQALREAQDGPAAEITNPTGKITQPGNYRFTLEHDGIERMYLVHVPAKYRTTEQNYGQISKSDREGFIVAFPNGISPLESGLLATWNAGTCCSPARDRNIDDVGFIRKMIERISSQLDIDRDEIFATGMSNGGLMAIRLACDMSDTLKAVASVAGTDNTTSRNPKRAVSVMFIHARNDNHVPFEGGRGDVPRQEAVTEFTSVPESVSRWVKRDACNATPRRVLDRPGAYCDRYAPCRDDSRVALCVTEHGAHSWPGAAHWRSIEPPSKAIDANDVMWDFFMQRQELCGRQPTPATAMSACPTRSPPASAPLVACAPRAARSPARRSSCPRAAAA